MHLPLVLAMTLATTCPVDDDDVCRQQLENTRALRTYKRAHGELSFGYLGQWADETNRALTLESKDAPPEAGRITEPFLGAPYAGSIITGPMLEARTVVSQVRFTVGFRFPFANFRPSDTVQSVDLGGTQHEVLVRSMKLWDLRTGLGFELPFERVTPFIDVLGDVQFMTTQLIIDGAPATYKGNSFSLGGRVGVRVQLSHVFLQAAAEATAVGPQRFGGSLMAGFAF